MRVCLKENTRLFSLHYAKAQRFFGHRYRGKSLRQPDNVR